MHGNAFPGHRRVPSTPLIATLLISKVGARGKTRRAWPRWPRGVSARLPRQVLSSLQGAMGCCCSSGGGAHPYRRHAESSDALNPDGIDRAAQAWKLKWDQLLTMVRRRGTEDAVASRSSVGRADPAFEVLLRLYAHDDAIQQL